MNKIKLIIRFFIALFSKTQDPDNLYSNCDILPLDIFIDCLINQNLNRLIKFGKAKQKIIIETWENIYYEFCELSGTAHYKKSIKLLREIGKLSAKLTTVNECILALENSYSKKSIGILKELGYIYNFNFKNKDEYLKDISSLKNRREAIIMPLKAREKEYAEIIEEIKKQKEITDQDFDDIIAMLSSHFKFRISKKEITVREYVAYYNQYFKEVNIKK